MKHKILELGRQSFSEDKSTRRRALLQLLFLGGAFLLLALIIASSGVKGLKRGILASKNLVESKENHAWEISPTCYEKTTGISHCYKPGAKN